jgi:hypothetical protein
MHLVVVQRFSGFIVLVRTVCGLLLRCDSLRWARNGPRTLPVVWWCRPSSCVPTVPTAVLAIMTHAGVAHPNAGGRATGTARRCVGSAADLEFPPGSIAASEAGPALRVVRHVHLAHSLGRVPAHDVHRWVAASARCGVPGRGREKCGQEEESRGQDRGEARATALRCRGREWGGGNRLANVEHGNLPVGPLMGWAAVRASARCAGCRLLGSAWIRLGAGA